MGTEIGGRSSLRCLFLWFVRFELCFPLSDPIAEELVESKQLVSPRIPPGFMFQEKGERFVFPNATY